MAAAFVDHAEQSEQLCPGSVSLVHGVRILACIGSQPFEQADDGVVVRVNGMVAEQIAVFGVQHEDGSHQNCQKPVVDVLGITGEYIFQQPSVPLVIRRLEASQKFIQRRHDLLSELR